MSIHPMPGNLGRCKHDRRVAGGDCPDCEAEDLAAAVEAEREAILRELRALNFAADKDEIPGLTRAILTIVARGVQSSEAPKP